MGLPGLLKYCLTNKQECVDFIDLVDIARKRGGIKLIVDVMTFNICLRNWFSEYVRAKFGNEYLMIIAEENNTLNEYVTTLLKKLADVGISLVWMIDAEIAGKQDRLDTKIPRLEKKHKEYMRKIGTLMDVCSGVVSIETVTDPCFSLLSSVQLEFIIRRFGCEVIQCPNPDGDYTMIKHMMDDEKIIAVLSNDTDFMIFDRSSYIPDSLFDVENNLHLKDETMITDNVDEPIPHLRVGVLSTRNICDHFQFAQRGMMIELSILKGNGFTAHFNLHRLFNSKGWNYKSFPFLAKIIRQHKRVENIPALQAVFADGDFTEAVNGSRWFYDITKCVKSEHEPYTYGHFLENRIEAHSLPPDIMTIYNAFYWRILIVEKHVAKWPCVEASLSPLRRYIYRMVLPPDKQSVVEFGRGCEEQFEKVQVNVGGVEMSHLQEVQEENREDNRNMFHHVMSHMERDDAGRMFELRNPEYMHDYNAAFGLNEDHDVINYFYEQEEEMAFRVYLLRYFLVLNWRQNLTITEQEFLALAAVTLRTPDDTRYQGLNRCPTPATVTMANWFLDIYRHAYQYLAQPLYLAASFPEPKDVFCGSAWTAFHACCDDDNRGAEDLVGARDEMHRVLLANRKIIETVIHGYFKFNPQNPLGESLASFDDYTALPFL